MAEPRPSGFTLVEVIVGLAVLAVGLGVAATTFPTPGEVERQSWSERLAVARHQAAAEGRALVIRADSIGGRALVLPDGRVLGPGVDARTAMPDTVP